MAHVIAPLLSLDAKGTYASALVFSRLNGRHTVKRKRVALAPYDPKTPTQLFNRDYFKSMVAIWHNLTESDKSKLDSILDIMPISGFNYYIRTYRERRPTECGNVRCGFSELGDLTFNA